jgi:ATP dependent DNA ligase C terminal region
MSLSVATSRIWSSEASRPHAARAWGSVHCSSVTTMGASCDMQARSESATTPRRFAVLGARLSRLKQSCSPFADRDQIEEREVTWVKPSLVAEIAFAEWTRDGKLRHPAPSRPSIGQAGTRGRPRAATI